MYVEWIERGASLAIFEGDPGENPKYDATCQLQIYGDVAQIHSIHGEGFYKAVDQIVKELRSHDIKYLVGYVIKAHARLLRMKFKDKFAITHEGYIHGHLMPWVSIDIS